MRFSYGCMKLLLVTGMWCGLLASTGVGQEVDPFWSLLANQKRLIEFEYTHEGAPRYYESIDKSPVPIIEFFTNQTMADELGIEQQLLTEFEARYDQVEEKLRKRLTDIAKGDANSADPLVEIRSEFFEFVDSKLKRSQKTRLREIQFRFVLRRNGILNLIHDENANKVLNINITDDRELRDRIRQICKTLDASSNEIENEALEIWLGELSEEQRVLFDRDWKGALSARGALGQLAWQLDYETYAPYKSVERDKLFKSSRNIALLSHGADGNAFVRSSNPDKQLKGAQPFYQVDHLFRSKFFKGLIQLVPQQEDEIKSISAKFYEHREAVHASVAGKFELPVKTVQRVQPDGSLKGYVEYEWPKNSAAIVKEISTSLEAHANGYSDEIIDVLLPNQQELLATILQQLDIRSRGPLADIEHGELGTILKLSNDDKQKIRAKAKTASEFIRRETRRVNEEAWRELLKCQCFSEADRLRIGKLLGAPLKHGYCDLRLFGWGLLLKPDEN